MRTLRRSGIIAAPPLRVFALLEDARHADALHPEWLRVNVERPLWLPRQGARSELRVAYRGAGYQLALVLDSYRPGGFLLERQEAGPFASFEHAAHLEQTEDGGTRLTEVLVYEPGLGRLGRWFDRLVLRRDLDEVLAWRQRRLGELLELSAEG